MNEFGRRKSLEMSFSGTNDGPVLKGEAQNTVANVDDKTRATRVPVEEAQLSRF